MTVCALPNMQPWVRPCIVALLVCLASPTGAEVTSASGAGGAATRGVSTGSGPPATPAADASPGQARSADERADAAGDVDHESVLRRSTGGANADGTDTAGYRGRAVLGPAGAPRAAFPPVVTAARTSRFAQASPDFSFGRPRFSIAFRGLQVRPRATGDFHAFVHRNFFARTSAQDDPLDPMAGRMSFNATGLGFDMGFGGGSRIETRVGVDYALVRALTEDRDNEDEFGLPIEQDTELAQWGVHGELALALTPRGRAIGQYVWIPSAVIPYVGAGVGVVRYRTVMNGRFVDVYDYSIFADTIQSQGWAPSVHVFGGVDFRLTRSVLLTTEARYAWAAAELDGALAGYNHDLTGLRLSAGVRFVF